MIDIALLAGRLVFIALLYLFLLATIKAGIGLVSGQSAKRRGGWQVRVVRGPKGLKGMSLPVNGPVVIGRSPGADIVIADEFVSSKHARLSPVGEDLVLEDLESTNGTVVDGQRVTNPITLKSHDKIDLGAIRLEVERT